MNDGENADDDDTGTETGEGVVEDKGGEIQTSGGDGSFVQFSVDGHGMLLVRKWWIQDDLTARQRWRHGLTWRCEETQKGTKVEQTKILAYGEQLQLKSGVKC